MNINITVPRDLQIDEKFWDFWEYPEVKTFIDKMFNQEYPKKSCPQWVDFEKFQNIKISQLAGDLYKWIKDQKEEDINEFWAGSLSIGYVGVSTQKIHDSDDYITGDNYFLFEVPIEVYNAYHKVLKGQFYHEMNLVRDW